MWFPPSHRVRADLRRRRFLGLALAGSACAVTCARAQAPAGLDAAGRPRELWITRPEAQETTRSVYWADGRLQWDGYRAISRIYRDLYAGTEHPIALALLNLNCAMQRAVAHMASPQPLVLLSGFRTRETNRRVGGVEPSSHFLGEADDYIFAGLSFDHNVQLARLFQTGGLGIYPDRHSLHKDLGRRRAWTEYGRSAAGLPPFEPPRVHTAPPP